MANRESRHISVTPEHEQFIEERVKSGKYQSASEVVREGLRLLQAHEQIRQAANEEFKQMLLDGYAQAQAGQMVDGPDAIRCIRQRLNGQTDSAD